MPVKTNEREYRSLSNILINKEKEKRIDSNYYVEGYATTFNKPYLMGELDGIKYYEMIDRNAFVGADMSDVIMQYDHTGKVLARISNKTLIVEPQEDGLFICADLSKSNAAKDLYEEIANGLIIKMSWAFVIADGGCYYDKDTHTRVITKIKKVYDVSAVSIPQNDATDISCRNFASGSHEAEQVEKLERRKRKLKFILEMEEK